MSNWSLKQLLSGLHDDIQQRLKTARKSFGHPGTKGDASEKVWLDLFKKYLPNRYQAMSAHIVDSKGEFSDQIDVVIFDRQYSPFIFHYENQVIIPAESVYAIFEAKQTINSENIKYAKEKIASVRKLYCTSLPIPHAGGTYPPKPPIYKLGGILTFESDWSPPLGVSLTKSLINGDQEGNMDLGCIAAHGFFNLPNNSNEYEINDGGKPATAFLLNLISRLQSSATVPMIDIQAYAKWLT